MESATDDKENGFMFSVLLVSLYPSNLRIELQ